MGDSTGIEWTDATWNPVVGCSVVSPGCTNCYAMKMANRLEAMNRAGSTDDEGYRVRPAPGAKALDHYEGTTRKVNGHAVWTGKVALAPDPILLAPLRWRRPRRIFVNSMGDLFHESVPDDWIDKVFAVMALARQHTFQLLTKRARRMREYLSGDGIDGGRASMILVELMGSIAENEDSFDLQQRIEDRLKLPPLARNWPLPNVWLGVSAEDQHRADERIPDLLATPAAVRFVSAEPLLGPIDLETAWHGESALEAECWGECGWCDSGKPPLHNCHRGLGDWERGRDGLDWVIAGGESGPHARPMHPEWPRMIRDQCGGASVPFFFKQWGEWAPEADDSGVHPDACYLPNGDPRWPGRALGYDGAFTQSADAAAQPFAFVRRVGKRAAGRLLDGREHNDMPGAAR